MADARHELAHEAGAIMGGPCGNGIIGLKGTCDPRFADRLHAEIMAIFAEVREVPGGALACGPERWYVEIQPERLSGFAEIAGHP